MWPDGVVDHGRHCDDSVFLQDGPQFSQNFCETRQGPNAGKLRHAAKENRGNDIEEVLTLDSTLLTSLDIS